MMHHGCGALWCSSWCCRWRWALSTCTLAPTPPSDLHPPSPAITPTKHQANTLWHQRGPHPLLPLSPSCRAVCACAGGGGGCWLRHTCLQAGRWVHAALHAQWTTCPAAAAATTDCGCLASTCNAPLFHVCVGLGCPNVLLDLACKKQGYARSDDVAWCT